MSYYSAVSFETTYFQSIWEKKYDFWCIFGKTDHSRKNTGIGNKRPSITRLVTEISYRATETGK